MHVIAALACALMMAVFASSASAQTWDPEQFGFELTETGRVGSSDAGAHPTVFTKFRFKNLMPTSGGFGGPIAHGTPRDVKVDMPFGLVGNPLAVPKCTRKQFLALSCPPQTQVGIAHPWPGGFAAPFPNRPIYNLEPDGTSPTLFGIDVLGVIGNFAYLRVQVRADGGLRTVTDPFPRGTPLVENKLELWGVPADENKCNPNNPGFDPAAGSPYDLNSNPCPTTDPASWERKPLMTSPTDCSTVPMSILRSTSYEGKTSTFQVSQPHAPTNCESLVFDPSIDVKPTNPAADGASGLSVDITVPQNDDPDERATPRVRNVKMTLPEGVSINPGAARDLEACPDATFGKAQETAASWKSVV